jgi:O-antigen/teichoic acid export membrane protein
MYFDRFVIGSVLSVAAVAYYTAPFEMVTRLLILPVSVSAALFPSFSSMGMAVREVLSNLYVRSVKLLLVLMGPIVMLVILFAGEILHVWLGPEFAEKSSAVVQILAVGVLANAVGSVSYALLQGLGRPDLTARLHILEMLMYLPLAWLLVRYAGIEGGALAWTTRIMIDGLLLFLASGKFLDLLSVLKHGLMRAIGVVGGLMIILVIPLILPMSVLVKIPIALATLVVYSVTSWRFVLDEGERVFVTSTASRFAGARGFGGRRSAL